MATVLIIIMGLIAGILSSLLGIGGGILLVPGLIFLLNFEIHKAIGTSLAVILPTALIGVYRHNVYGNINWKTGLLIAIGSVIGAYLGAWLSKILPAEILKKTFVIFILVIAFKLWRS